LRHDFLSLEFSPMLLPTAGLSLARTGFPVCPASLRDARVIAEIRVAIWQAVVGPAGLG